MKKIAVDIQQYGACVSLSLLSFMETLNKMKKCFSLVKTVKVSWLH